MVRFGAVSRRIYHYNLQSILDSHLLVYLALPEVGTSHAVEKIAFIYKEVGTTSITLASTGGLHCGALVVHWWWVCVIRQSFISTIFVPEVQVHSFTWLGSAQLNVWIQFQFELWKYHFGTVDSLFLLWLIAQDRLVDEMVKIWSRLDTIPDLCIAYLGDPSSFGKTSVSCPKRVFGRLLTYI